MKDSVNWSDAYIGIPWAEHGRSRNGVDCYGLAWLVYADLGIALPSYDRDYDMCERSEIAGLIGEAGANGTWIRVTEPVAFDLAVFARAGLDSHIGIVVSAGLMLHVDKGRQAHLARYDGGRWQGRPVSFWRHRDFAQ